MSRVEMCGLWRFSEVGTPYFQPPYGDYFARRLFKELGGFTPGISKALDFSDAHSMSEERADREDEIAEFDRKREGR